MELLTTSEVATLLGVSDSTVRRLIESGALPAVRLDENSWHRVAKDKLDEYATQKGLKLDWSLVNRNK